MSLVLSFAFDQPFGVRRMLSYLSLHFHFFLNPDPRTFKILTKFESPIYKINLKVTLFT